MRPSDWLGALKVFDGIMGAEDEVIAPVAGG
jgi:hypothetical protein